MRFLLAFLLLSTSAFAQSGTGGDHTVTSAATVPDNNQGSRAWAAGPLYPYLPVSTVNVTFPNTAGYAVVTSSSVADLQSKVTGGACNTIINIPQGASYNTSTLGGATGLVLPAISCSPGQWIIVQTASPTGVRGTRIDPSTQVGTMAKLTTAGTTERIISCAANVPCGPFWFLDIELDYTGNTSAIVLTANTDVVANLPNNLIFDHVYVHGRVANQTTHCFFVNGANFAIVDSWVADCHDNGNDSQAFNPYAGGPMLLQNDFLEAAGENRISMGSTNGAINTVAGVMPHDITETGNWYYKPLQWMGGSTSPVYEGFALPWDVKNIWESKACVRCLLQNSILENNWIANQVGKATLNNQAPSTNGKYSYTSDTTIQYIHIIGGAAFAFASARDGTGAASSPDPFFVARMNRVMWRHVLVDNLLSTWCQPACNTPQNYMGINNGIYGVIIDHVTVTAAPAQFNVIEDPSSGYQRAIVYETNNILPQGTNGGFKATSFASNSVTPLKTAWNNGQPVILRNNVFPGMPGGDVTVWNADATGSFTGTSGPAAQTNVGYVSWTAGRGGDYRLTPGSAFSATGTNPCTVNPDGTGGPADCGADVATINTLTAGIQTVPSLWPDSRSGGGILLTPNNVVCNASNTVAITPVAGSAGGSTFVQNGLDVMFNGAVVTPGASSTSSITITPPSHAAAALPVTVNNFGLPLTATLTCN